MFSYFQFGYSPDSTLLKKRNRSSTSNPYPKPEDFGIDPTIDPSVILGLKSSPPRLPTPTAMKVEHPERLLEPDELFTPCREDNKENRENWGKRENCEQFEPSPLKPFAKLDNDEG